MKGNLIRCSLLWIITLLDILENNLRRYDILNYNILCKYEDFQMFDLRYLIHFGLIKNLYELDQLRLDKKRLNKICPIFIL